MHIPDGYLSPQTFLPAWAAMIPFWTVAIKRVERTLRLRQAPMLALAAAFSFVIMMFNIPAFGNSSGHAVGAVLIAILLGPWAALVAVSLALGVQALLHGDGGITTLGANCLNLAVIMPFVGWGVYRLVAGSSPAGSRRRMFAAGLAGYIGLNAAALTTAVMFGIQPLIASDAAGRALYNLYPLKVALPVMAVEHLLLLGFVEAIVTALVVSYFQRTSPEMLAQPDTAVVRGAALRKIALAMGVLIVLTPLGLLASGTAWGEWGLQEIREMAGYLPAGMAKLASIWQAPLPDYTVPGQESAPLAVSSIWYVLSAIAGVAVIALVTWGVARLVTRKAGHDLSA